MTELAPNPIAADAPAEPATRLRPFTAVLMDLDGTIVDSAPGITSSIAATLAALGLPAQTDAELLEWVGPPLLDSFRILGHLSHEQAEEALDVYRSYYLAKGVFESIPYPGMPELLRAVHAAGIPMSLATSKPETPAKLILDHYGLAGEFDELTGASDDEVRSAKADVVAEALRRLTARGADLSAPVLIGDRRHDVEGAAACGVPTIFVRWGYGSATEEAGAIAAVDTPAQLATVLGL